MLNSEKSFTDLLKQRSPLILAIIGSVGVILTAFAAAKATPKASFLLSEAEKEKSDKLTKKEIIKTTWKCYIPAISIGLGTISCVVGSQILNQKQQAIIASACAIVGQKYRDYSNKVKDIYGIEAHNKILKELKVKKTKNNIPKSVCLFDDYDVNFDDLEEDTVLFYDSFSERYFESTPTKILQAEYHANRNFCLGGEVSLNDFYDFLGLETVDIGDEIGWAQKNGEYWIDFEHEKKIIDNEIVCYVINSVFPPTSEYIDDF